MLCAAMALIGPVALPPVTGVDGRTHRLLADANGRPSVVIFISHDCPICNTYAPELGRIARQYAKSASVDLIYEDPILSRAQAESHAKAYGLTDANLFLDPAGKLATACHATVTPEAVVFSSKGQTTYLGRIDDLFYNLGKQRNAATRHDLRAAIDATIEGEPPVKPGGPAVGCAIEY